MDNNGSTRANRRSWFSLLTTQPLSVQVLGGAATTLLAGALSYLLPKINLLLLYLIVGALGLLIALTMLIRIRGGHGGRWTYASAIVLAVASAAWCGGIAAHLPPKESSVLARPGPPSPSRVGKTVSVHGLHAGDCFDAPRDRSGQIPALPDSMDLKSCTEAHDAEVYFAGDAWTVATAYPPQKELDRQAGSRCEAAFRNYVNISIYKSFLDYAEWYPDRGDWQVGDRWLTCVAYSLKKRINYSVNGLGG